MVSVYRFGKKLLSMKGNEMNPDHSQGEIGLFVPDAGYPFGDIPEWLAGQRAGRSDWVTETKI
jgi:hypothetical protein